MNALMWKKYKWITLNLKNIYHFFFVPIAALLILYFLSSNNNAVLCYFPFISITLGIFFDQMDIENMVYKEYAMYTPMSLKESWLFGAITSWLFRFIYSFIILTLGMVIYNLLYGAWYAPWIFFVQGFINGISAFGVILFATQYEIDLSKWKQWLSFMWMPSAILWAFMLDNNKVSHLIPTEFKYCIYLLIFSLILTAFSFWQSKKVTTEHFINSLEGIRKTVAAKISIIDD